MRGKDITGCIFTRLTAVKPTANKDSSRSIIWFCNCERGNRTLVSASSLNSGQTKSCGCLRDDVAKFGNSRRKHGASKAKSIEGSHQLDYVLWAGIKRRCYNKNSKSYSNYGDRGIRVCKEWRNDFEAFAKYIRTLKNRPAESVLVSRLKGPRLKHSLDRINNDKGYRPGNIKWSTKKQQANNRRSNRLVIYKGRTLTLKQVVEKYSLIPYKIVWSRLVNSNWPLERAIKQPTNRKAQ